MSYRSESEASGSDSRAYLADVRFGAPYYYFDSMWPQDRHYANQYGWRSRGEEKAARDDLFNVQKSARWKDTTRIILAMDRIERALTNPLIRSQIGWDVHERTYSVTEYDQYVSPPWKLTTSGIEYFHFTPSFTLGFTPNTSLLSDSEIRTQGGTMLRNSRPTMPHASLGQWLGELRDFKSLFRSANLRTPKGQGKAVGGGYLSWQFGWAPFLGDLQKSAEAILDSSSIINKFLEESLKIQHRTREVSIRYEAYDVTNMSNIGNNADYGQYIETTNHGTPFGTVNLGFRKSIGYDQIRSNSACTVVVNERLKTFAKFEYFAYDPDGFLGRLASYEQKARHLLGLNLDPALAWELTPWSWMIDWWLDIGGFLSYQVSVEEDSLACRQSGVVYNRSYDIILRPNVYSSVPGLQISKIDPEQAWNPVWQTSYQRRLPGSPYDMGIDWSGFSAKRWFILGSLGLTKGPEIKWH